MTRARGLALTLLLLGAGLGCRGDEDPGEAPAAIASSPSEDQPDQPRLSRDAIGLTEEFRLAPAGRWKEALDVAVDSTGNVYVLDGDVPSQLLKFDATGRYLLRFGEGEPDPPMAQAQAISLAPWWNTIVVVDRPESVLNSFLTLGMQTYSVPVTPGTAIDALGMPAFGEYYLHGWDQARSRAGVYHMRLPIDTLATTYEVAIAPDQPVGKIARDVYFRTAVDGRGRLYVAFHDGYPVRVLEASGRTVAVIGLEREPVTRDPEQVAAETAENLDKLRERLPDVPDSLLLEAARVDPVASMIEELAVDSAGRLWVRTNRPDAAGSTYDVFDDRGLYLARVDVPGEVKATTFAPDGRLFVIDGSDGAAGVVVGYDVRL